MRDWVFIIGITLVFNLAPLLLSICSNHGLLCPENFRYYYDMNSQTYREVMTR